MPRAVALAACAAGAFLILVGFRLSRLGRESRGWTRAQGRVVVSTIEEIPGPAEQGGPSFRPVIRYGFEARGRVHESEQLSVDTPAGATTSSAEEARRWVERHPAGSAVDVWYDPLDPSRSVLVRGVAEVQVVAAVVIGLALLASGLVALAR